MRVEFASSLLVLAAAALAAPPDPSWGNPVPWSRCAEVATLPGMQAVRLLNDGDPSTVGIWCPGAEGGGEVAIRFPQPLDVTMFRFVQQGGGATKYRLLADIDGTGDYATVVAERADPKAVVGEPIAIPVNRKIHGLKIVALEGNGGYRAPFPDLSEIEIYSPAPVAVPTPAAPTAPALVVGAAKPLPEFKRKEIDIRLSIDAWHAGIPAKTDAGDLAGSKAFQEMLSRFKEADANSARFFAMVGCCEDEMPWKSDKLWPGHGADQLAPLAKALHANGLKTYFFSLAWMSPFQQRGKRAPQPYCGWDYPYEQSDRLVGVDDHYQVAYPCVISDSDFHDKWLQLLDEAIGQGADGVYLMPDEYYFKGHNLARVNCPLCAAAFKRMYGYDSLPKGGEFTVDKSGAINRGKLEDSEQYRKWKLFEYQKIASLFQSVSTELKRRHPGVQIAMSDNKILEDLSGRLEHNICLDIIEDDPSADLSQCYGNVVLDKVGWISAYVRRIAAAAGQDKLLASIQWLNVYHQKPEQSIYLHGYALPQIMLGAKAYENYRLNYMHETGWWPNVLECHKMIRLLEQWGVRDARTPEVACLILSRASEDWWRTRQEGRCGGPGGPDVAFNLLYAGEDINKSIAKTAGSERDRVLKLDALRGVGAKLVMESLLCEAAVPYQVAFADRLDNLENIKRFKLLVMPFCYSLSEPAFAKLKEAVEAGTRLVVFDQLAPADEFGNLRPEPLIKRLLGKPNVSYVKDNLAAVGNGAVKRAEYLKMLGDCGGYGCEASGLPVECLVRSLPQGYIMYLSNWDDKMMARPVVSLPGLGGGAKVEAYSSKTKTLSDATLPGDGPFAVELAPGEVKLLRIQTGLSQAASSPNGFEGVREQDHPRKTQGANQ